jgi:hypothetical protein
MTMMMAVTMVVMMVVMTVVIRMIVLVLHTAVTTENSSHQRRDVDNPTASARPTLLVTVRFKRQHEVPKTFTPQINDIEKQDKSITCYGNDTHNIHKMNDAHHTQ